MLSLEDLKVKIDSLFDGINKAFALFGENTGKIFMLSRRVDKIENKSNFVGTSVTGSEWAERLEDGPEAGRESWFKRLPPEGSHEIGKPGLHRIGAPALKYYYTPSYLGEAGWYENGLQHNLEDAAYQKFLSDGSRDRTGDAFYINGVRYGQGAGLEASLPGPSGPGRDAWIAAGGDPAGWPIE